MVPEAKLEATDMGQVPLGEGWFVLNAKDARWYHHDGRGAAVGFCDEIESPQVGINLYVLAPGEPIGMYHWEADQEDFLILSGEGVLLVEGEERPLRQWDFVHCPPYTKHIIVGAGTRPCAVLAVGARKHQDDAGWGGYTVDEVALQHNAGVAEETTEAKAAYAHVPRRQVAGYRNGWLPES
jgi:uncharacterized cupin superfamily protein